MEASFLLGGDHRGCPHQTLRCPLGVHRIEVFISQEELFCVERTCSEKWNDNSFTASESPRWLKSVHSWSSYHTTEDHSNFLFYFFPLVRIEYLFRKKLVYASRDEYWDSSSHALLKPMLKSLPLLQVAQARRKSTNSTSRLAWHPCSSSVCSVRKTFNV